MHKWHKWFVLLLGILLLGDTSLSLLDRLGELKEFIVAYAIAFAAIPWVVSQFDR